MKNAKRLLSFILTFALVFVALPVCLPTAASAATTQKAITTIDFESTGGWSGSNGSNYLSVVTDPNDDSNHVMKMTSINNGGYNLEIANGSNSTSAYVLEPSTSYTVSFEYKPIGEYTENDRIAIYLGTAAGWNATTPKLIKAEIKFSKSANPGEWNTLTATFTTTANQTYNEYITSSSYTHVCNKLYIVYSAGASGTDTTYNAYVDNIVVTNNDAPVEQKKYTNYNFNNRTGLSNKANDPRGKSDYITDATDSSNICVKSTSTGFVGATIELASSGNNSSTPFSLQKGTSYTITFRYRIDENSHLNKRLSLYIGNKFTYDANVPKKPLAAIDINEAVDYNKWFTFTHTFTMTDNLYYQTNSGTQYVYDKLYITVSIGEGSEGGSMYIDDVVIINNDIEGSEPDTSSSYEIKDFTHSPYLENGYGANPDDWRVSGRMFSTTDGTNSVLKYQYSLHPEHITEGFTSSGTGTRGNFMGTNGYAISSTNFVTDSGKSITIQQDSAYRISFKYKVTSVEAGSYIGFAVVRGSYSKAWTESFAVGTIGQLIFRAEHAKTDDWKEVEFTFLANFTSRIDKNNLKLGMVGYGECLIDDIVIEAIPENEVEPIPDTSAYNFSTAGGKATINEYKGTATELTIPTFFNGAMLDAIADGGFLFSDTIKSITIPGGLTKIGSYAFEKNYALKTIEIPSTVSSIGDRVFYDTPALETINVHSENANYVSIDGVLYNKDKTILIAYPSGKGDATFTVPSTVTEIAPAAFQGAKFLYSVNLPAGLIKIGENAFRDCSGLNSIEIPSSVLEIGASAFRNCTNLTGIEVSDDITFSKNTFYGCSELFDFGNLDSSSSIDPIDALKLAKFLAGRSDGSLSFTEKLAADTNRDGEIDLVDSAILQRHLAGWSGYEELPCAGRTTETYAPYQSTSPNAAELVVNLTNTTGDHIVSNRDIEYDDSKEDIIIILVIGQSNNTSSVGYASEQSKLAELEALGLEAPEAPTRPEPGTVYSSSTALTSLTSSRDAYYLSDTAKKGSTYGGSTPALGKALYDATGAKVVFIQSAMGATGMHEWVKDPENYTCTCSKNGKGNLYSNAIKKYLKTYYSLKEQYNVISTGYYWNQGEHEEVYAKTGNTVHDVQSYYDAYVSMHNDLLKDCEFDFGSIFMPRSVYQYHRDWYGKVPNTEANMQIYDTVERSRCTTVARQAMYRVVNDISTVFVASNFAETMKYGDDDIVDRIHYSQKSYNAIGRQAAATILSKLNLTKTAEFTGITVYNSQGIILATFDKDGKLTSGSKTVDITNSDNHKLHIAIEPLGTYYTYDISYVNVFDFSSNYFDIDAEHLSNGGYTSFDIVINVPAK